MRFQFAIAVIACVSSAMPSYANPAFKAEAFKLFARDPATLTCAVLTVPDALFEEIRDLKIRRNIVTIEYVDDGEAKQASCYFDKEPDGKFRLSYAEYFKAMKRGDGALPTSVGALTQHVDALKAKAQFLPFYPIDASMTLLGDVNP